MIKFTLVPPGGEDLDQSGSIGSGNDPGFLLLGTCVLTSPNYWVVVFSLR